MPYKKETAYNNLPILPPHAELETVQILKKTVSANKALAELHGWTYMQANPLLLLQTVSLQETNILTRQMLILQQLYLLVIR